MTPRMFAANLELWIDVGNGIIKWMNKKLHVWYGRGSNGCAQRDVKNMSVNIASSCRARGRIMLWILICEFSWLSHLSLQYPGSRSWVALQIWQCKSHSLVVYFGCHEILCNAAIRCHLYYLIYSKYLGALTISWKICSQFGKHTVDCISHKSKHIYHSLLISGFDLTGRLFFAWICGTAGSFDLLRCPWQSHSACTARRALGSFFFLYLKQDSCTMCFLPI